ncbi:MAG: serine hydrolase domain-containing protein, partial [Spirochaetota bacterium]
SCTGMPGASPVSEGSVFDVASITKSVPTSCLALHLVETGGLRLDDQARRYLPELAPSWDGVLVRHLLTQTLGFGFRLSAYRDRGPDEILDAIFTARFTFPPGAGFGYCNATSIVLGMIVERTAGIPLDELAERVLFTPLGMGRTSFHPLRRFSPGEIVPTELDGCGGEIRGVVHDESARVLSGRMVPGSAGLFSTAPDLLRFSLMLLNGGRLGDAAVFSGRTVAVMHTNQIGAIDGFTGMGWELNQPRFMGPCSEEAFGKTGFTGCSLVCDPRRGLGLVLLSNYTWPRRKPDRAAINRVRRRLADILYTARWEQHA